MRYNINLSIVAGAAVALAVSANARAATVDRVNPGDSATAIEGQFAQADAKQLPAEPDNSGRNVRDQGDNTLTPTAQSNDPADVELTRKIRRGITADDSMSVQAQNIKIITQSGVVTLRGPVKTAQEKTTIEALAKGAGATRIANELEIDRDVTSGKKD
jgi:hyperosmotically inducible periplasmic protein